MASTDAASSQYVIDQGGASFTAHLYVFPDGDAAADNSATASAVVHAKEKARTLLQHVDDFEQLSSFLAANPFVNGLVDRRGGTIEDYSNCDPKHYVGIAQFLALCYNLHLGTMMQAHCPPGTDGSDIKKTVRQTGKIRAKLLQDDEHTVQLRKQWYAAMRAALGPQWDYALIPTSREARLEGTSFFRLNDLTDIAPPGQPAASVAGIGIGSSSTQLYALDSKGELQVAFDSFLGCKPTSKEKAAAEAGNAKSAETFEKQFSAVLQGGLGSDSPAQLLYCHGAFGYVFNNLFDPSVQYPEKEQVCDRCRQTSADCWRIHFTIRLVLMCSYGMSASQGRCRRLAHLRF